MTTTTIHGVGAALHDALIEYIEATYHIGDPSLVKQRRTLLEREGVIFQAPYLESTPRYQIGCTFESIEGLPSAARDVLKVLSTPLDNGRRVLHNPPYTHQSDALTEAVIEKRNLLIKTGTGSGKTESFLMPILSRLAIEAFENRESFQHGAMRAMILYPMNALVNDQLGRLRAMFGDERITRLFRQWGTRPARFARYTSRTPYAGVRSKRKDQLKLKPFNDFYIDTLRAAADPSERNHDISARLVEALKSRGKWPAKPDLEAWYGQRDWQDAQGNFIRAVTLPSDAELLTRHESQAGPPDLMVTNYSMLEYMLMRPVEASIFDLTRDWLEKFPHERFTIVLDEAHLYRGSAGAEVGLLLRRLRDRLRLPIERFQIICATASFENPEGAKHFASRLSGAPVESFRIIEGDLRFQEQARAATHEEADLLASLDMRSFYGEDMGLRQAAIKPVLNFMSVTPSGDLERDLHAALQHFAPLGLVINTTMREACDIEALGRQIFPLALRNVADTALTNLCALATSARLREGEASLLPCRVHTFFRGLRGLWVCMDPQCSAVTPELRGVAGKLYSQPRDLCECGARVLEFFTCRLCGTAYARGYCTNPLEPTTIWRERGATLRVDDGETDDLHPIDLLLTPPVDHNEQGLATYDLVTGVVDGTHSTKRTRDVYLSPQAHPDESDDDDDDDDDLSLGAAAQEPGIFHICAVCTPKRRRRTSVQDHETKGDQPFQVLVMRQIQVQAPGPQHESAFAPLRGRKVLTFSDSRQVAARLAPNLQMFSSRDALRPLVAFGWKRVASIPSLQPRLSDLYAASLIGAHALGVRLRPELKPNENFKTYSRVGSLLSNGGFDDDNTIAKICHELREDSTPPHALLADILSTVKDRARGFEAIAIASVIERADVTPQIVQLPNIAGLAENDEDKLQVVRAWLRDCLLSGFWLPAMPAQWLMRHEDRNVRISALTVGFQRFLRKFDTAAARTAFKKKWLPDLLGIFAEPFDGGQRLKGLQLTLQLDGEWQRCSTCKSVHRPVRTLNKCLDCGRGTVIPLQPDTDEVFLTRKGYFRNAVTNVLGPHPQPPMSIVAAEHTAQLNSSENADIFSKAEINELLFQDVDLNVNTNVETQTAIDVLSSTTTMEVGIDIGQLSGVAMRNMPPGRANYQQRAGRAGRRANAIASVVAFGGSDTHDEHFFSNPAGMIRGPVVDPTLSLENTDIARRHLYAFLLQCYLQDRISAANHVNHSELFSVLGKVAEFLVPTNIPGRDDLEVWLKVNEVRLRQRANEWLPTQIPTADREALLSDFAASFLATLDKTLPKKAAVLSLPIVADSPDEESTELSIEIPLPMGEAAPQQDELQKGLLASLLDKGVLPKYAFPTDVATFHVFDLAKSSDYHPVFAFTPSQGTSIALTQYAPDKQVWIANKCYQSGALYAVNRHDRLHEWKVRKLHAECERCGYTELSEIDEEHKPGAIRDCPACNGQQSLGPAHSWLRPLGFAHPVDEPPLTSPEEIPETSYATRAKLTMRAGDDVAWIGVTPHVRVHDTRQHLMVSNVGPKRLGYSYCVPCGRIEGAAHQEGRLWEPHPKPYPDSAEPMCAGSRMAKGVVLGTDFITDIALFSLQLGGAVRLKPADTITHTAMRTLCVALSRAATELLQIEAGEVLAEYRPAMSVRGCEGLESEIFLYDTLPGGAGFAREAAQKGVDLFRSAKQILEGCPDGCDFSCYRCLRDFRNRLDHGLLDRHVGAALVDYLLTGSLSEFNRLRLEQSSGLLYEDLRRQPSHGLGLKQLGDFTESDGTRHIQPIEITDARQRNFILSVSNPISCELDPRDIVGPNGPAILLPVNEIVIRRNLAAASSGVRQAIASS